MLHRKFGNHSVRHKAMQRKHQTPNRTANSRLKDTSTDSTRITTARKPSGELRLPGTSTAGPRWPTSGRRRCRTPRSNWAPKISWSAGASRRTRSRPRRPGDPGISGRSRASRGTWWRRRRRRCRRRRGRSPTTRACPCWGRTTAGRRGCLQAVGAGFGGGIYKLTVFGYVYPRCLYLYNLPDCFVLLWPPQSKTSNRLKVTNRFIKICNWSANKLVSVVLKNVRYNFCTPFYSVVYYFYLKIFWEKCTKIFIFLF